MKRKYIPKSDEATMRRQRAQKRNFALFQIKGAESNLVRIAHESGYNSILVKQLCTAMQTRVRNCYLYNHDSFQ